MEESTKRLILAFIGLVMILVVTAFLLSAAKSRVVEQSKGGNDMSSGLKDFFSSVITGGGEIFEQPISQSMQSRTEADIQVSHSHGNITVKGWDRDEVKLEGKKIVRARDVETARMYADQMKVEMVSEDSSIIVKTIRPERDKLWKINQITINYELFAPRRLNVALEQIHGNVIVEGFSGKLDLNSRHGNLQVAQIGKDASITHEHGNVEASQIDGNVSVSKMHGNLTIGSVGGELKLNHEHGNVSLLNIGKGADLRKRHGDLVVTSVSGLLKLDHEHGKLQLKSIQGDITANKLHGNITVETVKGNVSIQSDFGNLKITGVEGNVHLRGNHGDAYVENVSGTADVSRAHSKVKLQNVARTI